MPNYYEMDEETDLPELEDDDSMQERGKIPLAEHSKSRPPKPPSSKKAISPSIPHYKDPIYSESHEDSGAQGVATRLDPMASSSTSIEHHDCPICGKHMATDNQGLNAHIDFCLSKGAILAAQAVASSPGRQRESTAPTTKRK